ncbi:hypothetical protein Pyn_34435 [Prunus yedoensis var. nudiflora]|uniref:Uncharacterized protein n=1 Tax=Prunus yedoensis var. nudiflora TaxID=2094558 RepID=A0A314YDU7_PRUYE|nr:hypothetical protein Pyn_34435 [Prunus yedoensis var. nudiflora]
MARRKEKIHGVCCVVFTCGSFVAKSGPLVGSVWTVEMWVKYFHHDKTKRCLVLDYGFLMRDSEAILFAEIKTFDLETVKPNSYVILVAVDGLVVASRGVSLVALASQGGAHWSLDSPDSPSVSQVCVDTNQLEKGLHLVLRLRVGF